MEKITKEEVCKWLDIQVKIKQLQNKYTNMCSEIKTCVPLSNIDVHIYSGLDIIANILEVPLSETISEDLNYTYMYEYSLVYKGIRFFEISKLPMKEGKIIK